MSRAPAAVTSIALVVAVAVGVFASASFATQGMVSEKSDLLTDVKPMAELRTRGSVKAVDRKGTTSYALDFTAVFTAPIDSENQLGKNGQAPDLTMRQSISFPTLSENRESVGPVGLPFASQTLALEVVLVGECFQPSGDDGYRLKGFDPKCAQAFLSLEDGRYEVTELFRSIDSRLTKVGRDGATWMWRTKAAFDDPGYGFPIVSLGYGGTTEVVIGDMGGAVNQRKISFNGG